MALLEVRDLRTSFFTPAGEVKAVNGVSFNLDSGKVLGIVGESGSGKSVTAYSIFLGCCLLTFYCLSHLPMITVNVLECSAYVYILFFDRIFFGKPITMRKVGGNLMIIAGIIICLNR